MAYERLRQSFLTQRFLMMSHSNRAGIRVTVAGIVAFLAGCGSSTGVDSGLPDGKLASDLTVAEAQQLCSLYADGMNEIFASVGTDYCVVSAYGFAANTYGNEGGEVEALRESCAQRQAQCESDWDGPTMLAPCMKTEPPSAGCRFTVAQYEACVSDQFDELRDDLKVRETCETLTLAGLALELERHQQEMEEDVSRACQVAQSACPGGF